MLLNILEITLAITLTIAIIASLIYLFTKLVKKGTVSISVIVRFLKKLINIVDKIDKVNIPFTQRSILNAISVGARLGVEIAEQLYLEGEIAGDKRFEKALNFTKDYIRSDGININSDTEEVIKQAIEESVSKLPKTH